MKSAEIDEKIVLPGSEIGMTCGVNLPLGTLYSSRVFTRKPDEDYPITYIEKQYQNIEGTSATSINETVYDSTSRLYKVTNDFQRSISKSYKGKLSFGGLSAGIGTKITNTVRNVNEESRSFLIQNGHLIGYRSQRLDTSPVTDTFVKAYNKLPDTFTKENYETFKDFFEKWGTHYVDNGAFGGFFTMVTYIDENEITRENSKKIERDVSIGFKANTDSGEFSASKAEETIMKQNEKLKNVSVHYSSMGGGDLTNLKAFLSSCRKSPVLMVSDGELSASRFEPLSSLVEGDERETAFNTALEYYATRVAAENGIIGSSIPIDGSLQTTAENSQLVLSSFNMLNWPAASGTVEIETLQEGERQASKSYASISSFARKKDRFQNFGVSSGLVAYKSKELYRSKDSVVGRSLDILKVTAYNFGYDDRIGFGKSTGENQILEKNYEHTFTADQDGILTAGLSILDKDKNKFFYATLGVSVGDDQSGEIKKLKTGCCVFGPTSASGSLPATSCALPIRKGESVTIKVVKSTSHIVVGGAKEVDMFWSFTPIEDHGMTKLGKPISVNPETKVTTKTDGFLSVFLKTTENNKSHISVSGFCFRSANELMSSEEMRVNPFKSTKDSLADIKIEESSDPAVYNPYSSFLIPIPKGNSFTTGINPINLTNYDENIQVTFYPLELKDI